VLIDEFHVKTKNDNDEREGMIFVFEESYISIESYL
jgi:hypothetical protein